MSIIVALHTPGGPYGIASDSRWTSPDQTTPMWHGPKIYAFEGVLVGVVGAQPGAQAMVGALHETDAFKVFRSLPHPTTGEYPPPLLRSPVGALRTAHARAVAATGGATPGEYPKTGAEVLLVCQEGIWEMDSCGCVMQHEGAWAIGCGAPYALGALLAWSANGDPTPSVGLKVGVNAACHFLPSCGGPVQILTSEPT